MSENVSDPFSDSFRSKDRLVKIIYKASDTIEAHIVAGKIGDRPRFSGHLSD